MADPKPDHPKTDRTEMWKALKWTMILLVCLVIAIGLYKAWQIATAPARVVENAFAHLNELPKTEADNVKARGFRMTNLRGAESRVCEMTYNFGSGSVPIFLAADNKAHAAAKKIGSNADRLIRIVIVSPEETLGLNAIYEEDNKHWSLGWRPSSINKPYPDEWAETPISNILKRVPKACVIETAQD